MKSGLLNNRLSGVEIAPPTQCWDQISRRLDEEFQTSDTRLSHRLNEFAIAPPATVWNSLSELIPSTGTTTAESHPESIVRKMPFYRRLAAAAAIAALLAFGAMYFFAGENSRPASPEANPSIVLVAPSDERPANPSDAPDITSNESRQTSRIAGRLPARTYRKRYRSVSSSPTQDLYIQTSIPQEAPATRLRTVGPDEQIAVTAPPIRDEYGRIIMDMDLIRQPNERYITVTSPSGDQVRLSDKFINCLRYLNDQSSSSRYDVEAEACKSQFRQWREKLLSDPDFVPAASNFFDILQMKEMLQD